MESLKNKEHSFAQLSGASSIVPALGGSELACLNLSCKSVWTRQHLEGVFGLGGVLEPFAVGSELVGLKLDKPGLEDS